MPAPGATTNRDAIIGIAPPFFPVLSPSNPSQPGAGGSMLYAIGLMYDAMVESLRQGVASRFPGAAGTCPDALPLIGKDRQIDRGFDESDSHYAARLSDAFNVWATAGSAWSVLRNILGAITPFAAIVRTVTSTGIWDSINDPNQPANGWPTWRVYPTVPGNWNWDNNQTSWWRFFPIVYAAGASSGLWQAAPNWGSGGGFNWGLYSGSWGLTATPGQISLLRKIVSKWLRGGSFAPWIIVSLDATMFPPLGTLPSTKLPDGTWQYWSKFQTVGALNQRVPSRSGSARYCDGAV